MRVCLKANPKCVGTIVGVVPAKRHHTALLGTVMSFTVEWDGKTFSTPLTYGEDVLEFLPVSDISGVDS